MPLKKHFASNRQNKSHFEMLPNDVNIHHKKQAEIEIVKLVDALKRAGLNMFRLNYEPNVQQFRCCPTYINTCVYILVPIESITVFDLSYMHVLILFFGLFLGETSRSRFSSTLTWANVIVESVKFYLGVGDFCICLSRSYKSSRSLESIFVYRLLSKATSLSFLIFFPHLTFFQFLSSAKMRQSIVASSLYYSLSRRQF